MSLENWNNYSDRRIRRQEIDSFLEGLLELEIERENQSIYIPDVEIKETVKAFYLKIEIPGTIKRQIDLELNDNTVIIQGKRTFEQKAKDEKLIYSDFRYGRWQRIISLPMPITVHGMSAEYAYGILELVLYKQNAMC